MSTLKIKAGSTLPKLLATLKETDDAGALQPLPLNEADSVTFRFQSVAGAVDKSVDFTTDGADGKVEVGFTVEETEQDGWIQGEFVIDWGGGEIQKVPSDDYVRVRVIAALPEP